MSSNSTEHYCCRCGRREQHDADLIQHQVTMGHRLVVHANGRCHEWDGFQFQLLDSGKTVPVDQDSHDAHFEDQFADFNGD